MRNVLLSASILILSAGVCAAQQQPGNPYAPGSFNNDTQIYQGIISNDADAYLRQLKARQSQQFVLPSTQSVPYNDGTADAEESRQKQRRIMQMYTDRDNQRLQRALDEVRHLELLNAIERRR